ncbi:MAG TPA: iron-sulfur cluster repair di-iron protein [Kofleriaceae bacterium]|jgi:regulator of cell morphogenesis and NO signaling|nr:iron-sulfur cluster repair di-iron protein [Kofleriaceae bacterium]
MNISNDTTVGEVAAERPASLRVFERAGIDYCCGGRRSLASACAKAGVAMDELLAKIDDAERVTVTQTDWRSAPLADLIDHIEAVHHTFTRDELARATTLMEKVARVHGEVHPELPVMRGVLAELREELIPHLAKEERVLFPRIRAGAGGIDAPVSVMLAEHDHAGDLLQHLRFLSKDYRLPDGACGSYRALYQSLEALEADLKVHIHLESNILFPRAAR